MTENRPRIVVRLTVTGRSTPILEGYRPHLVVPPDATYLGVWVTACPGPVGPGEEAEVEFALMYHPIADYAALCPGAEVEVREGAKVVAVGVVVRGVVS